MADASKLDQVDPGVVLASADPEDEREWVPQHPEGDAPGAAVQVTSPVRLDQLAAEVAAQAGRESVGLSVVGDPDGASADQPAQVYTSDDGVTTRMLLAAAKAHQPDAGWSR